MLFCLLILENKKTELTFEVSLTVLKVLKQTKEQGNQSISIQTDVSTTQVYAHISPEVKKRSMNQLENYIEEQIKKHSN